VEVWLQPAVLCKEPGMRLFDLHFIHGSACSQTSNCS
jgi:hypothetical protein